MRIVALIFLGLVLGGLTFFFTHREPDFQLDPRVDEIGKERLSIFTDAADGVQKMTDLHHIMKKFEKQQDNDTQFSRLPWPIQDAVNEKYGKEIEEQRRRLEAVIVDEIGKERLKIFTETADGVQKMTDHYQAMIKFKKLQHDNDKEFSKLPRPLQVAVSDKYGKEIEERRQRLEAALYRLRPPPPDPNFVVDGKLPEEFAPGADLKLRFKGGKVATVEVQPSGKGVSAEWTEDWVRVVAAKDAREGPYGFRITPTHTRGFYSFTLMVKSPRKTDKSGAEK